MKINSYKELVVWQKAIELVKELYKLTNKMPPSEKFVLIPQMLRAAISVPSNIAEGWARNHKLEFIRFLSIAFASSTELETQIIICSTQHKTLDHSKINQL